MRTARYMCIKEPRARPNFTVGAIYEVEIVHLKGKPSHVFLNDDDKTTSLISIFMLRECFIEVLPND